MTTHTTQDDLTTIDGLISVLYDVISGPAGVEPDWQRERNLFASGARLIPTRRLDSGEIVREVLTDDEYIASRGPYLREHSFYERPVAARIERFGHLAHVWSTYESSETADGPPFSRGINSIQLIHVDGRWWVQSIMWAAEREDLPIPAEYLK